MGISARTENWRVTQWRDWATGTVVASELYDHRTDPDEVVNLADNPAYAEILAQQQRLLPPHRPDADGDTSDH
jgi:iduronate 2-sulfatase